MSTQERLDKLESLILQAGGNVKVFNLMQFGNSSKSLKQIENLLGDMIAEVLALKKDLGCTSTLSIVEPEKE